MLSFFLHRSWHFWNNESDQRCSIKKAFPKNYAEFLYSKVTGRRPRNFMKKRFQYKCFHLKYCKSFKSTYFEEHLRRAASGTMSTGVSMITLLSNFDKVSSFISIFFLLFLFLCYFSVYWDASYFIFLFEFRHWRIWAISFNGT